MYSDVSSRKSEGGGGVGPGPQKVKVTESLGKHLKHTGRHGRHSDHAGMHWSARTFRFFGKIKFVGKNFRQTSSQGKRVLFTQNQLWLRLSHAEKVRPAIRELGVSRSSGVGREGAGEGTVPDVSSDILGDPVGPDDNIRPILTSNLFVGDGIPYILIAPFSY